LIILLDADIKVLITGASGFIGKHLCQALVDKGIRVVALSRRKQHVIATESYMLDLCNRDNVFSVIERLQPDYVVHLAAVKTRSVLPSDYHVAYEENFLASLHLIEACQKVTSLKRFIYVGSCEEYGEQKLPFKEEQREKPTTAYGVSKLAVTQFLQTFTRSCNFPAIILRPSLVYGPGQGTEMFLPAMIQAIVEKKLFPMTHGEQTRDYLYVDDLVSAIECALFKDSDLNGQLFNVSSGMPIQIKVLARMVARLIADDREVLLGCGLQAYRAGEAMAYWADNTRASKLLNWNPRVLLEDGLLKTIQAVEQT
jgi:UDP-glucose 4-epimerase|tara:strand:- start:83603 stop:84538 length:936 start_codon:yes stop_codon:yes gene_type:complete